MKNTYVKMAIVCAFGLFTTQVAQAQVKPGSVYLSLKDAGNAPIFPCPTDPTKPLTFTDNGITYVACVFNDMQSNMSAYLDKYKMKTADPKAGKSTVKVEGTQGRGVFNDAASDMDVTFYLPYYSAKGTILKDYPVIWVDNKGNPICEKDNERSVKYGKWVTCNYNGPVIVKIKQTSCSVIKEIAVTSVNIGLGTMTAFVPAGQSVDAISATGFLTSSAGSAMGVGVDELAKRIFIDKKLVYHGFLSPKSSRTDCLLVEGSCTSSFKVGGNSAKCKDQITLGRGLAEAADQGKKAGKSAVKKTKKAIKKAFK